MPVWFLELRFSGFGPTTESASHHIAQPINETNISTSDIRTISLNTFVSMFPLHVSFVNEVKFKFIDFCI